MPIRQDTIVAILLMVFTGVMWNATYDIQVMPFSSLPSNVWPRVILIVLGGFSALLLLQSLVGTGGRRTEPTSGDGRSLLSRYRNALIVYGLFLGFLLTLPYLGMLIGSIAFVFLALTLLGRPDRRMVPIHLAISVGSVGVMWAIFTFALRVILPQGELLSMFR